VRNVFAFLFGCLASLNALPGNAGVLIPVPPIPGSYFTLAFDINDDNIVAGFFVDASSGKAHAFYESLDGNYTVFDDSSGLAMPQTINNDGIISGQTVVTDQGLCDVIPFERGLDGTIVHIKKGKKPFTGVAAGLNNKGEFVGYYCDKNGGVSSYYGKLGKYKAPLTVAGLPLATVATGINNTGIVAGYFSNTPGQSSGFLLHNGITTVVTYPGANATALTDINDHGLAAGTATDAQSQTRAFVFDTKNQTFQDLDVFGGVQTSGMNNEGLLIVNMPSSLQSFVFCMRSKKKCPSTGTEVSTNHALPAPAPSAAVLRSGLLPRFLEH